MTDPRISTTNRLRRDAEQRAEIERKLVSHVCERCECSEDQLFVVITAKTCSLKILSKDYSDVSRAVWGDDAEHLHDETMAKIRAALAAGGKADE